LDVLRRRWEERVPEKYRVRLDLRETDLRRADLRDAHLEGAFLLRAHLEGAFLLGAYLEGAHLIGAHLEGAHLEGAHLEGTNLYVAIGLTLEQIERTIGDDNTVLPEYLVNHRPPWWSKSLEEQEEIIWKLLKQDYQGE
jgi:hypothetical protein